MNALGNLFYILSLSASSSKFSAFIQGDILINVTSSGFNPLETTTWHFVQNKLNQQSQNY